MVLQSTQLSPREWQVLGHIARGQRLSEVAEDLYISRNTVHTHARTIRLKLGASNAAHAVYLAMVEPTPSCG